MMELSSRGGVVCVLDTRWLPLVLLTVMSSLGLSAEAGQWSPWSSWTPCSATCLPSATTLSLSSSASVVAGTQQHRYRVCDPRSALSPSATDVMGDPPLAAVCPPGNGSETRQCVGLPECKGKTPARWSPWSNWTPCIRLCGGVAVQRRLRNCLGGSSSACSGPLFESRDCTAEGTPSPLRSGPHIHMARFVMGENNLYAMEGSTGVIVCCADLTDNDVELKIFHRRSQLVNDSLTSVLLTEKNYVQVTISPLNLNHSGAYSCFTRDDPNLVSTSSSIFVRALPTVPPGSGGTLDGGITGLNKTNGGDGSNGIGDGATNESDDFLVIIIPIMASVLFLLILTGLLCFIHRRRKSAGRGAQAVQSSNHIINKVDVLDNRKIPIQPTARPSCMPYLSRSRQPIALHGGLTPNDPDKQNFPAFSFMPTSAASSNDRATGAEGQGSPTEPFRPVNAVVPYRKMSADKLQQSGPTQERGTTPDMGHSTHRLNVYSPAEAERAYSKSYEKGLKTSPLNEVVDSNMALPTDTISDNGVFSDGDDEKDINAHHALKKIKSTADDEDELFRDIAIACESQSIDINELVDNDVEDTGRIARAISMELERRRSSEMHKTPLHKLNSAVSSFTTVDYNPSEGMNFSPEHTSVLPAITKTDWQHSVDHIKPVATGSPMKPEHFDAKMDVRQCFEDFARSTVPHLMKHTPPAATPAKAPVPIATSAAPVPPRPAQVPLVAAAASSAASDMSQVNTQSLPRTREHTDTLDRSDMTAFGANPDTLKRANGLLSPSAEVPVTIL
ncbi:uncharacterized protein LOC135819880 [Sycon ciliatum]|uniref:uncharacterized protein LOC135819880 n=1 Tax=Sycon ciliatum TaxID=27933 RepID=UPI0031F65EE1